MKLRLLSYVFIFLLLTLVVLAASGDNEGMDETFDYLGLEKPNDWASWNKEQKFSYLQSMRIYPAQGGKYSGNANTDGFFDWLRVDKPQEWDSLSFDEKQVFVDKARNGGEIQETAKQETEERAIVVEEENTKDFQMPSIYLILSYLFALLVVAGSFVKPSHPTRKILRKGVYYGLPIILLLFSFLHPERLYFRALGDIAERLLIFLLFVKPLAIIFQSKFFMRAVLYRRESGIASFWFFIFHGGGLIFVLKLTSISNYLVAFMFWGVIAGIGMLILAATSNNISIQYFKKNWKKIQYLAYPSFFAVLIHSSLWMNGNLVKVYVVGGLFLLLKMGEYFVLKNRKKKK